MAGSAGRATRAAPIAAPTLLDPDAIADSYFHLHRQQRNAWAWEIELRPGSRRSEAKLPRGRLVPAIHVLKRRIWR
jgi:hypothetical protein